MKKLSLTLIMGAVMILSPDPISAQGSDPHSTFQLGFVPPLSTNGKQARLYTNDLSLNILLGISRNERIATVAGLGSIIHRDARGFHAAGLFNWVGRPDEGNGHGVLLAGVLNRQRHNYFGAQLAGGANMSDSLTGGQLAAIFNRTRNISGVQFAGGANLADSILGGQAGGVFNVAKRITGVQIVGAANDADLVIGGQVAGVFNNARKVAGVQIAALANYAQDITGAQIGTINVAREVKGVQIGVFNIAQKSEYPIGLVNIIEDGDAGVVLGYNETGTGSITLHSGGRRLYGVVGVGYNFSSPLDAWSVIVGFGANVNLTQWLRLSNELRWEAINDVNRWDGRTFKVGYSLMPSIKLGRKYEIFGGPSINFMQSRNAEMYELFPTKWLWRREKFAEAEQGGENELPGPVPVDPSRPGGSGGSVNRLQQWHIGWQVGFKIMLGNRSRDRSAPSVEVTPAGQPAQSLSVQLPPEAR